MGSDDAYTGRMDRISKLPDELLSHIFSFLPFKSVVKTSILSKRWEYAWKFASCLDLTYNPRKFGSVIPDFDHKSAVARFKDVVDNVLFCHGGLSIKKCVLHFLAKFPCPSFYAWICAVVASNVQELHVSCIYFKGIELPLNFYTCKTLVVLKLSGPFLLDLPFYVCFPRLKTLSLKYVMYGDDLSMQRLFSSCPVLEDLLIVRKRWDGVLIASVCVPSLRRLTINFFKRPEIVKGFKYKMVIDAPCLESLTLVDDVSQEVSVKADSLVKACIHSNCASKVLKQLSHVKDLTLYNKAMKNLNAASHSILPFFGNLTTLQLGVYESVGHKFLFNFLKNSPNLEALFIQCLTVSEGRRGSLLPWNPPESPPDCLLNLKHVQFESFGGTKFERALVRYILKRALVLEKMVIIMPPFRSSQTGFTPEMLSTCDNILSYRKASPTCQVKFGLPKRTSQGKNLWYDIT